MTTPKQAWKAVWREQRMRHKDEDFFFTRQVVEVNGHDIVFQRCSWTLPFGGFSYNRAVKMHARMHQFLNDVSTGVDTYDEDHVELVQSARQSSQKEGFKLP